MQRLSTINHERIRLKVGIEIRIIIVAKHKKTAK